MEDKQYYFLSYLVDHGGYSSPAIMNEVTDMHPFILLMERKDDRIEFEKEFQTRSHQTVETIISFQEISQEEYLMFQNYKINKGDRNPINT